jgi:8-oxo-dGTP pyrophosphatase MutT (NUDIX family)
MDTTPIAEDALLLKFKKDAYDGAIFSDDDFPESIEEFDKKLKHTMEHLRKEKFRGCWLKIKTVQSQLIQIAHKYGFVYHHCKCDYVMMTTWLPTTEINKLPHYASHSIGIGGFVINKETKELLTIQERVSLIEDLWKLPGGSVDLGEFLPEAVEREVFEETGIKCKFQSLLGFRDKLKFRFDQPDLYFVALCEPKTFEIKIDPFEIANCKWMKIEEFLNQPKKFGFQHRMVDVIRATSKLLMDEPVKINCDTKQDMEYIFGYQAEELSNPSQFSQKSQDPNAKAENVFYYSGVVLNLAKQEKISDSKL